MKKISLIILMFFVLSSCWEEMIKDTEKKVVENKCENPYKIWNFAKENLKLKWVVISDDTKNISSPIAGKITYLNCNAWKKVYSKTLIAKITPDYNNPNIANLSIQKASLVSQKSNIDSLKTTTINNFDNQISDLKSQIDLIKKNIELTKKSWNLSTKDLQKQISSLEDTLKSLENNLELLKKSKVDALEKINISKKSLYSNILNIAKDNLLKIDETFWITKDNKDKNDKFENYLWTKDTVLLNEVKSDFRNLNNKKIEELNDEELSKFLWYLIELDDKAKDSVKESIENIYFSKTQIDTYYNLFLNFSKNITELKSSWDSIENSITSTNNSFDTQISSLDSQIIATKNNLDNLKENKLWSVDTANELQLSNLDAQLKTLNTNLSNLISNKKSQIINFDNQILQLNQSISSLNSSLYIRNVYAWVTWIVKQKVSSKWNNIWAWMSLCQIIPNAKSTKIKIYSPVELNIWDKLLFEFNQEKYEIIIENALIYKDAITQNYVYESNYLDRKYFKDWEIISLNYENNNHPQPLLSKEGGMIKIPLNYIKNKIDWNFVKTMSWNLVEEKKVELWDINWKFVEIKSGLDKVNKICK